MSQSLELFQQQQSQHQLAQYDGMSANNQGNSGQGAQADESQQNNHYYGYPPYHYPTYRDNFPATFPQPIPYPHCQPPQHSYAPVWPLKSDSHQFNNNPIPPQIKPESTTPQQSSTPSLSTTAPNTMELAHLNVLHHDIKPDPLHLGMSILNLPTSQANPIAPVATVPPPLLSQLNTNSTMDSNITLWQFLLELLTNGEHSDLIQWTNNEGEFKLMDPEGISRLWGVRKGKHQMNYDKLSRALRYYYDKNIIKKVNGQKFVYRFVVPSEGANADMLSYTMQRSMGIHQSGQTPTNNNSLLPPPSTSLPRPLPTNHSIVNTTPSSTQNQQFIRRVTAPSINTDIETSTSRPLTVTNNNSTPSPINSTCSPGSVGSSSGVSSAGTSASNLSDVYHHMSQQHQNTANSGPSSRPSSTASLVNHQHHQQQHQNRKRKRDDNGVFVEKIKIEPPSSYNNNGLNDNMFGDAQSPNSGGGLSRRKPKPVPLDLTAVSNVNNNLTSLNNNTLNNASNAMSNLVAAASPLFQNSPALLNIYAATLSANFMQNQASPLNTFTAAALASPLHFAAAMAASPTLNPANNNNLSMFGNSLSALTTPIPTRTPQQQQNTNQSHGQFFQFPPPSSQASAHFALAALLRSPGLHSPFLTAMGLGTPTAQSNGTKFNMSPNDALKTPIPPIREI